MQLSSHDKGQVDNFRFVWITHESVRSDLCRFALLVLCQLLGRLAFRVQPLPKALSIYKPKINIMATCVSLYPVYVF